jgi:hypothetical protein
MGYLPLPGSSLCFEASFFRLLFLLYCFALIAFFGGFVPALLSGCQARPPEGIEKRTCARIRKAGSTLPQVVEARCQRKHRCQVRRVPFRLSPESGALAANYLTVTVAIDRESQRTVFTAN